MHDMLNAWIEGKHAGELHRNPDATVELLYATTYASDPNSWAPP